MGQILQTCRHSPKIHLQMPWQGITPRKRMKRITHGGKIVVGLVGPVILLGTGMGASRPGRFGAGDSVLIRITLGQIYSPTKSHLTTSLHDGGNRKKRKRAQLFVSSGLRFKRQTTLHSTAGPFHLAGWRAVRGCGTIGFHVGRSEGHDVKNSGSNTSSHETAANSFAHNRPNQNFCNTAPGRRCISVPAFCF